MEREADISRRWYSEDMEDDKDRMREDDDLDLEGDLEHNISMGEDVNNLQY